MKFFESKERFEMAGVWSYCVGVNYETKEDKLVIISRIEWREYRVGKSKVGSC